MTIGITITPPSGVIRQGEYVYIEMTLPSSADTSRNFFYNVAPNVDVFEDVGLLGREVGFLNSSNGSLATWLKVKSDAVIGPVSLTFTGTNSRSRDGVGRPVFPTPESGVYNFDLQASLPVEPPHVASFDSVSISFLPVDNNLTDGDYVYIEMSTTGSNDTFEFELSSSRSGIFDSFSKRETITIGPDEDHGGPAGSRRGSSSSSAFLRVLSGAAERNVGRSETLTINPIGANAESVRSLVEAAGNTYDFNIVAPPVIPVRTTKTGSVEQPTISNANGLSVIHPGDVVRVLVRLVNADLGDYRFYFTQTGNHFDFGDDQLLFGFEEGETERTILIQTDPAVLSSIVNGQLSLHANSDDALDILSGTEGLTVQIQPTPIVPPHVPNADSINISFTPIGTDLQRGDYVYLTMSLVNPTDDAFTFFFNDERGAFETTEPFTIQGSEIVNTFLRVSDRASFRSGQLSILGDNTAALGIESLITTAYGYNVVPVPVAPVRVPKTGSVEQPTTEPDIIHPGDVVRVSVRLLNAVPGDYRFYFTQSGANRHFDFGEDELRFGFDRGEGDTQGETEITLLLQTASAPIPSGEAFVQAQLAIHPDSDDALDILSGAESFTVQITRPPVAPAPSADSVNIALSPSPDSELMRGDYIHLTMSLEAASDDAFIFEFHDQNDNFEELEPFTIQGSEEVKIFLRVKADATIEESRISFLLQSPATITNAFAPFDYVIVPVPIIPPRTADAITITTSPTTGLIPGSAVRLEMILVNADTGDYQYTLSQSTDGVFDFGAEPIQFGFAGGTKASLFLQISDTILTQAVQTTLTIAPSSDDATDIENLLPDGGIIVISVSPAVIPPLPPTPPPPATILTGPISEAVRGGVESLFGEFAEMNQEFSIGILNTRGATTKYNPATNKWEANDNTDLIQTFTFSGLPMGVSEESIDSGQAERGDVLILVRKATLKDEDNNDIPDIVANAEIVGVGGLYAGQAFVVVSTETDPTASLLSLFVRNRQ